jgi:hypothetical protein
MTVVVALGLGSIAWAEHVTPELYGDEEGEENNPSCAFLNPSWNEVKVNQAPNGSYPDSGGADNPGGDGKLVFTIENSDGKVFDWTSNIGVDAVVVKGGNRGSNVYFYGDEPKSDQDLRSPDNTQDKTPAVSHVSACYDEEAGEEQGGQEEGGQEEGGEQEGGGNERPAEPEQPEDQGGDEPSEPEQPEDEGGDQPSEPNEPQDEGDGRDDDGGGNQRPAEPDEPQQEGDEPVGNQRPAEPDEPDSGDGDEQQGAPDEQGEDDQEGQEDEAEDEDGESDVRGISESDDGASDDGASEDVAEEGSGSGDDLPFTGAPLGVIFLVALGLMLAGAAGRTVTRD